MLRGYAIVLFTIFLFENVCANGCGHDNCETAIDIPLITKLNAPLKAELDITSLTVQLKDLIGKEVKQAVSTAVNDLVKNILDKTVQTAVDRLQTSNSVAMATFRKKMEAELEVKIRKQQTILDNKLKGDMEQLKSELKKATEKGKFTCEKPGLYLIGAYILSYTKNSEFDIMKNGIMVSRVFVRPSLNSKDDNHHTGTGIIAVQLDANDTLHIKAGIKMQVNGSGAYSCLTAIKVK